MVILSTGQTLITSDPERPKTLPVSMTQPPDQPTMTDTEGNLKPNRPWTMTFVILCITCMFIRIFVKCAKCNPISILSNTPNHGGDLNKLMPLVHNVTLEYKERLILNIIKYSIASVMKTPVELNSILNTSYREHVPVRKSSFWIMNGIRPALNNMKYSNLYMHLMKMLFNVSFCGCITVVALIMIMTRTSKCYQILKTYPEFKSIKDIFGTIKSIKQTVKKHGTLCNHFECLNTPRNRSCHQKLTTYLHAVGPNAQFRVYHVNFSGLDNPKFEENTKFYMRKVKISFLPNASQCQGHAHAHWTPIVSRLSNLLSTESEMQKTSKNGFFTRNKTQYQNPNIQIKNIHKADLTHKNRIENKEVKTCKQGYLFLNIFFLNIKMCHHHDQAHSGEVITTTPS